MLRKISVAAGCALLAACGSPAPEQAAEAPEAAAEEATMIATPTGQSPFTPSLHAAPPYKPVHDVLWLMENVVQPSAEVFWGSAGFVIDATGEHSLRPTTDEAWADVVTHAAIVAEMGNLLMTPIYAADKGDDWIQFAGSLVEIGMRAQAAAESRDEEMIFDVGATMDAVCEACHTVYIDPNRIYPPVGVPDMISDDAAPAPDATP